MAKKKSGLPFDSRGGVVTIQRRLLTSDAYLALSPQAKALIHLLQVHWRPDKPIGYGIREAERSIPCSRKLAIRAFKELVNAKFIEKVDDSLFCSRAKSKTRTWHLTWMPWNHLAPSNKWEKEMNS